MRRVGIDGDEVTDRGIPVAARARGSPETPIVVAAAEAAAVSRSLSEPSSAASARSAWAALRVFLIPGNGGSGIDGGGCDCGLRYCWC